MERSATGILEQPMNARGFTLIEVLVVVAIAATLTALVVLRLGQWQSPDDPARQLERLSALISHQCEQAMFQSRPRGIRIAPDGYDFWQQRADGWLPLAPDGSNRPRELGQHLEVALSMDGYRVELDDTSEQPQIVCQPLGELTPFELTLESGSQRWRLRGQANGQFERDELTP